LIGIYWTALSGYRGRQNKTPALAGRVFQTPVQIKKHLDQKGDGENQKDIDYRETADLFTFFLFYSLSLSLSEVVVEDLKKWKSLDI